MKPSTLNGSEDWEACGTQFKAKALLLQSFRDTSSCTLGLIGVFATKLVAPKVEQYVSYTATVARASAKGRTAHGRQRISAQVTRSLLLVDG